MDLALVLLFGCALVGLLSRTSSRRSYAIAFGGGLILALIYLNFPSTMT
jgi:hypothetical protein